MSDANAELEQRIRERAYFLWQEEGCPEGRSAEFWDRARALEPEAIPPAEDRCYPAVAQASTAPADPAPAGAAGSGLPAQGGGASSVRAESPGLSAGMDSPARRGLRWPSPLLALATLVVGAVWVARRSGTPRGSRPGGGRGVHQERLREGWRRVR